VAAAANNVIAAVLRKTEKNRMGFCIVELLKVKLALNAESLRRTCFEAVQPGLAPFVVPVISYDVQK
jgi:hypothetical protein